MIIKNSGTEINMKLYMSISQFILYFCLDFFEFKANTSSIK